MSADPDEAYWSALPVVAIDVDGLILTTHAIDFHQIRKLVAEPNPEPIRVEQLYNGRFFIHDGRHRAYRAMLDGKAMINAKVRRNGHGW